ncbi:unnamed protein product [Vitrella brassicaformis CCMP3155]|uniref:RING-type domain-containing protein n=3 Tax=Vitrella brassicaformis TaxID=1169539 RepID=A0A0G4H2G4_VITBC|nr:unnamed protein product [Vitrella brassicaformis CCMP3155]|eukprot:CEM37827.1 unnamed protein product [Vitrella brassicaformis CCMP3155]
MGLLGGSEAPSNPPQQNEAALHPPAPLASPPTQSLEHTPPMSPVGPPPRRRRIEASIEQHPGVGVVSAVRTGAPAAAAAAAAPAAAAAAAAAGGNSTNAVGSGGNAAASEEMPFSVPRASRRVDIRNVPFPSMRLRDAHAMFVDGAEGLVVRDHPRERRRRDRDRDRDRGNDGKMSFSSIRKSTSVVIHGESVAQRLLAAHRPDEFAPFVPPSFANNNNNNNKQGDQPQPAATSSSSSSAAAAAASAPVAVPAAAAAAASSSGGGMEEGGGGDAAAESMKGSGMRNLANWEHDEQSCSICFEPFEVLQPLRRVDSCGHKYHMWCLDEWLEKHDSCPLCRLNLQDAAAPFLKQPQSSPFPSPPFETARELRDREREARESRLRDFREEIIARVGSRRLAEGDEMFSVDVAAGDEGIPLALRLGGRRRERERERDREMRAAREQRRENERQRRRGILTGRHGWEVLMGDDLPSARRSPPRPARPSRAAGVPTTPPRTTRRSRSPSPDMPDMLVEPSVAGRSRVRGANRHANDSPRGNDGPAMSVEVFFGGRHE